MKLILDNLTCKRGERTIISALDFEIAAKNGAILEGANGAGKTTLLRTLAGFLRPGDGRAFLEGGDPEKELAEECHYIGHLNGIKHTFSVEENMDFWASYLGGCDKERALEIFHLADLRHIPAGILSAGQKRRLGLSRLVLVKRPVWLLDEPSVSLDVKSVKILADVVDEHIQSGGIAIAATHVPLGFNFSQTMKL